MDKIIQILTVVGALIALLLTFLPQLLGLLGL
jgi:preprotein translocase subunit SecY